MSAIVLFAQSFPPMAWIIIGSLFLTAGDLSFRYYIDSHWSFGYPISLAIYLIGIFFLTLSFFGQNIAIATIISILINITVYMILAYFLFNDTISMREFVGVLVAFLAIYILETGH